MRIVQLSSFVASSLLLVACVGDAPSRDDGSQPPIGPGGSGGSGGGGIDTGSGSGSGSGGGTGGGSGSGSGSGSGGGSGGGGDQGVPPQTNDAPSVSVATTSNTTPIRLTTAITTNGCNIPANTTSGCPASVPSTQTLDGVYRACHIAANQSDCQATTIGYVECPVGFTAGALSVKNGPPAGQAGYGSFVKLMRSIENGRVTIRYDAYEVGVRADGTIAWEGPHGSGLASASAQSCSAEVFRVFFPGSDEGEKVAIDLQWF